MGDSEQKRRRYCLMCNVFKPERCHHCSTCNRCVLNMDHHCPWVNNCIGFWNRKPFLLLIFYAIFILYFYLITMGHSQVNSIIYIFSIKIEEIDWRYVILQLLMIMLYFFMGFLSVMLSLFFKFHIMLIVKNITTLENLEKKGINFDSPFDVGKKQNWEQVFGINIALWFVPIHLSSGKPKGNGVNWPQKVQNEIKMMNYEDFTQPDETAEYEAKKSLAKAGTLQSQSQQASDARVPMLNKGPIAHEADYHENIKKSKPTKKAVAKKQDPQELTNKVEVQENMQETKKITFKREPKDNKYILQH